MVSTVLTYTITAIFVVLGAASVWVSFTGERELKFFVFGMFLLFLAQWVAKSGGI